MKSNVLSFVVATVSTAVIASACCGPFGTEPGPERDNHLTVAVAVGVDDAKEPVCDATVTAYPLDGALSNEPNEDAPLELKPELLEGECVYRADAEGSYEVRVSHPDHGEATVRGVAPDQDSASPECGSSYTGVDGVDEIITLEG